MLGLPDRGLQSSPGPRCSLTIPAGEQGEMMALKPRLAASASPSAGGGSHSGTGAGLSGLQRSSRLAFVACLLWPPS